VTAAGRGFVFSLDTSFLVPLLLTSHEWHGATVRAYQKLFEDGSRLALAPHAILETYSVLTRLPAPYRLRPADAYRLLSENFESSAIVPALTRDSLWPLIARCSESAIAGGRLYDSLIASSAREAGAQLLFTYNAEDFMAVAPPGLEIRQP
jgi:toxin FitB